MTQLSPAWLGLGPVAASPWLIGLLVGVSWLLARVLSRIYAIYENSGRLQCFPQPPKRNWLLGHLGMVSEAAGGSGHRVEGLSGLRELGLSGGPGLGQQGSTGGVARSCG